MWENARTSEQWPALLPDSVVAWRAFRMRSAGFGPRLAEELARNRGYDLHAVLDLAGRGCPPELVARILAPLGSEAAAC